MEVGACLYGILYGHYLLAIDALELLYDVVVVALLIVKLVYKEDDGFAQLLGVAEVCLCTHLRAILAIEQQDCGICHRNGRCSGSYKVVTARTVDDIQFLVIPFTAEYGREYRITILLLNGEVVTDGVLLSDSTTAFYNPTLIEQRFCEGGFT